jgi:hypothetical protein
MRHLRLIDVAEPDPERLEELVRRGSIPGAMTDFEH